MYMHALIRKMHSSHSDWTTTMRSVHSTYTIMRHIFRVDIKYQQHQVECISDQWESWKGYICGRWQPGSIANSSLRGCLMRIYIQIYCIFVCEGIDAVRWRIKHQYWIWFPQCVGASCSRMCNVAMCVWILLKHSAFIIPLPKLIVTSLFLECSTLLAIDCYINVRGE